MSGSSVLFVWRTVADVAVHHNECRTALRPPEDLERVFDAFEVIRIADAQDVPTVPKESCLHVLSEREARAAFDRNVIVIVDPAEIVEAEVSGQRCRFGRNTLHQAAIAANGINAVVEDLEVWPIEVVGEPLPCDRHANARGDTLAEGPGGGLHTGYPMVLRVAWGLAVELAKPTDIVERNRRFSQRFIAGIDSLDRGEMERGPEQHGGMAIRQYETITVGPDRILWIEAEYAIPDRVDE